MVIIDWKFIIITIINIIIIIIIIIIILNIIIIIFINVNLLLFQPIRSFCLGLLITTILCWTKFLRFAEFQVESCAGGVEVSFKARFLRGTTASSCDIERVLTMFGNSHDATYHLQYVSVDQCTDRSRGSQLSNFIFLTIISLIFKLV